MITNFTKKVGLAAAISIVTSSAATAAVFNASASFRTIADITITEASALSFGTAITGKAGSNCVLTSIITAGASTTTVTPVTTTTGTGCSSTDAVNGGYDLAGANNSTVTILMATATDTDFNFAPAGQYNDLASSADVSTTYFPDAPLNVSLSATGKGLLSVGGTLNIVNELVASTSYAVAYDISVVY